MRKKPINIPDLFTREDDVCYGMIEVYSQDADGLDLTTNNGEKFEKFVPAVRAICYNSPGMYKALREIVSMIKSGSTSKEIAVYAKEIVEKVENSYSYYKELQL